MSTTTPTTIADAVDAWRKRQPSELEKVLMLSYLTGLLDAMEQDGELSRSAVREVVRAFARHTTAVSRGGNGRKNGKEAT